MLETLLSSDQVVKIVRTCAQAIGGLLVTLLLRAGIEIDSEAVQAVIYPICVGLWVIVVDLLVKFVHPAFENLNVISKTPAYGTVEA